MQFYKVARSDGLDIYTGKTINYRENIGKTVRVPNVDGNPRLCSNTVIHASRNPNDGFIGAELPCSIYVVEGEPVTSSPKISGFKELYIVKEVPQNQMDELLGWRYSEGCNPVHPFKIPAPKVTDQHVELLKNWISIWDSIWDLGIRMTVWPSIRAAYGDPVADVVGDSNWILVGDSVKASVGASVRATVNDALTAYTGSFFPNIREWMNIEHKPGEYPFQPAVDLWRQGLVAAFDGKAWRLHGGLDAEILLIEKNFVDNCVKF